MNTKLTDEQLQGFRENGFILMRNLVRPELIRELHHSTVKVVRKYNPQMSEKLAEELLHGKPWEEGKLDNLMLEFRSAKPDFFGAMYDTLQNSVSLTQLVCSQELADIAGALLDDTSDGLCSTGQMLRMDPPRDKRNALSWHQEISYYDQNLNAENGLVMWTPLHDVRPEHGPVVVCPKSHTAGQIKVQTSGKSDYVSSEQYTVPEEWVQKFDQHQVVANAGDVLFFNMNLFHRSGDNTSNRIRFVAGVRYHRMLTDDFMPGRHIYTPNVKVGRRVS